MSGITSSNRDFVSSDPATFQESTPAGSCIQYSDQTLDLSSPFAGGAAWIEGDYVPAAQARISVFDAGLAHSDITYTVPQVWHGRIFRLDDHLDRLLAGAEKLRIEPGMGKREIAEIVKRCVCLSQLREAFVNIMISRGYGNSWGEKDLNTLTSRVYVYAIPYLWVFPPQDQIHGTSVVVAQGYRRAGLNVIDPTIKNCQWGDLTAATFEAEDRGATSAVLLDNDNCVAEGAGFNVVVVKDGSLASPSRNALPGITRRTVFELANDMGMEANLRDVARTELYTADELMAVTTAGGVTPIVNLDGRDVGNGEPGPITTRLRDRYWALMDEDSPYLEAIDYDG